MAEKPQLPGGDSPREEAKSTTLSTPTRNLASGEQHARRSGEYGVRGGVSRIRKRRDNLLYLPWWSLALMLMAVIGISFGVVALILSIGGGIAPASDPRIVVITAAPTQAPASGAGEAAPPSQFIASTPASGQSFALEGPTLEAVPISPTPRPITVGETVIVTGVAGSGLNIRAAPGITTEVLFVAAEGTAFRVIDGPVQEGGLAWWNVEDALNPGDTGWAASNFLIVESELNRAEN